MKKEFKTPMLEIIEINNSDVRTINSGDTTQENELPLKPFGGA